MPETAVELIERVPVAAPARRVWDALTAWDRQSEWMICTQVYATALEGWGVGGELTAFTGIGPLGFKDTMVITEWSPPKLCRVRHTGHVVRGTATFEVAEDGPACAMVTWSEFLLVPFGRLGEVGWTMSRPAFAWALRRSLRRFAQWAPTYPQ